MGEVKDALVQRRLQATDANPGPRMQLIDEDYMNKLEADDDLARLLGDHFGLPRFNIGHMSPEQYQTLNPTLKDFVRKYLNPIDDPSFDEYMRVYGPLRPVGTPGDTNG